MAELVLFTGISRGTTVLQLALMPVLKRVFGLTPLVDAAFQVLGVSTNADGSTFSVFDYAAGAPPG